MKKQVSLMMEKNKKKSGLMLICTILLALMVAGCSTTTSTGTLEFTPKSLAGYIVLQENTLYLDEVELITTEYVDQITGLKLHDPTRIAELDLDEGDMSNGYYIHNANTEMKAFELTDITTYTFTDYNLLFVEDADGDRLYTTTKSEEFIQHLNKAFGRSASGNVPFFIEVKDGKLISITEKFIFTQ